MGVDKAIIGASYNDSGSLAAVENKIDNKAHEELSSTGISNHYFLRSADDSNSLRYSYSLRGIPIVAYSMMNFLKSSAKKICVVGGDNEQKVFEHFIDYFNAKDRFVFAHEGYEWSFANSLKKGKAAIEAGEDELVLFNAGDLPHGFGLDSVLKDNDAKRFDYVIDLNCRERIYGRMNFNGNKCAYNRRWHLPLNSRGEPIVIKETNLYLFTLDDAFIEKIDILFSARKTYDDEAGGKGQQKGGRIKLIGNILKKPKFWINQLASPSPLTYLLLRGTAKYTGLKHRPHIIRPGHLSDLATLFLGRKTKIKAKHNNWGFLADIDSAEDLMFNECLMMADDPSKIYPYWNELKGFGDSLREVGIPIVNDFPEYLNEWFSRFSLLKDNVPFDSKGNFIPPDTNNLVYKDLEKRVEIVRANRKTFVRKLKE